MDLKKAIYSKTKIKHKTKGETLNTKGKTHKTKVIDAKVKGKLVKTKSNLCSSLLPHALGKATACTYRKHPL